MTGWVEAALSVEDAIRMLSPETKRRRSQVLYDDSPKGRARKAPVQHVAEWPRPEPGL